jgi:hypothetical protein
MSTRCKGKCLNGKRCKKNTATGDYCFIHDISKMCLHCKEIPYVTRRLTLECGHTYNLNCVVYCFKGWFDGITNHDKLYCPECNSGLNDKDFELVATEFCRIWIPGKCYDKEVEYNIYICAGEIKSLGISLNKRFSDEDLYTFYKYDTTTITDKTEKRTIRYTTTYDYCDYYYFYYGDPKIREYFKDHVFKELMEYVYHPSRLSFEVQEI